MHSDLTKDLRLCADNKTCKGCSYEYATNIECAYMLDIIAAAIIDAQDKQLLKNSENETKLVNQMQEYKTKYNNLLIKYEELYKINDGLRDDPAGLW